jgi:hypothetical protein
MTVASFVDVCRFVASSAGTGDFVVNAAVTGYQTPTSAGAVDSAIYRYRAESSDLTEWEVGYGAYTSGTTTLARTTVLFSSTGAKVSFTAAPQVALVCLAEDLGALPLQTLQTVDTTNRSTTSTSFAASGVISPNLSPKTTSNQILVQCSGIVGAAAAAGAFLTLYRSIGGGAYTALTPAGSAEMQGFVIADANTTASCGFSFLDSPATTSTVAYQIYFKSNSGAVTVYLGRRGVDTLFDSPTVITVQEIRG